jgi:hypothetical protein
MKVLRPMFAGSVDKKHPFLVISCSRHNKVKQIVESVMTQEKGHEACTILKKLERELGGRTRFVVRRKTDVKIIEETSD